MSGVLQVDFNVVFYMVVGIFALAGFMRGWWKEAITTGILVFLLILLTNPELASTIISRINELLAQIRNVEFVSAGATDSISDIDPAQNQIYIIVMVVLVIVSYFIGNSLEGNFNITTGGRIFGAVLGMTNGFIILSLLKEYVLGRYLPEGSFAASATAPEQLSITVTNVPQTSITDGFAIWLLIFAGALILIYAITNKFSYTKGKFSTKPPLGYNAPAKK